MVFHVLNRGVARMQVFEKAGDYQAFGRVLHETLDTAPMRICASCLMPRAVPSSESVCDSSFPLCRWLPTRRPRPTTPQ
jgi:hypothetical protein